MKQAVILMIIQSLDYLDWNFTLNLEYCIIQMKTMFLLGAGASKKAGVPDGYDMSKKLLFLFSNDPRFQKYHRVLSFIIGGLIYQKAKSGIIYVFIQFHWIRLNDSSKSLSDYL